MESPNIHVNIVNACPNNLSGMSAHLFLTLINTLMSTQCYFNRDTKYPTDYGPKLVDGDQYDFIVVGGGTAGSVVASRLSEVEDWKVLVLEAGGYPSATSEIPSLLFSLQGTDEDWKYKTETSDSHCLSMKDKACRWPRGKVLGGCSTINAMLYVRGNKRDYDNWAKLGNPGWDYESVLPYFKMSENIQDEELKKTDEYGKSGPLPLSVYDAEQPITEIIKEAAQELGYPPTKAEKPLGYLNSPWVVQNGERMNTGKAFLGKVKDRQNLHVALNSHVLKIIFNEETKAARGVLVKVGEKEITIYARKEIILSAGAINTPQLLMLSGIGPKQHLESLGIKPLVDLKGVGENLQDHSIFPGVTVNIDEAYVRNLQMHEKINEIYKYFMYRDGELARISITNFIGFINTKRNSEYPNIQMHHVLNLKNDDYLLGEILRSIDFVDEYQQSQQAHNSNSSAVTFFPTLLNPKSKGKVLLRSADPRDSPLIHANYFADESDLEAMLEGIRYVEELIKTKSFEKAKPEVIDVTIPNCKNLKFRSDEYWKCAIKNIATTLYHPAGTAKMGPRSDPMTVVGPDLKVHGVQNLRVMDTSVMPDIMSGNTMAPAIMIAQKGSSMVIDEWKKTKKHDEL